METARVHKLLAELRKEIYHLTREHYLRDLSKDEVYRFINEVMHLNSKLQVYLMMLGIKEEDLQVEVEILGKRYLV